MVASRNINAWEQGEGRGRGQVRARTKMIMRVRGLE